MNQIKIAVKDWAQCPTRSNPTDAGIDFYWPCGDIALGCGQRTVLVDTGVSVEVPKGYMLQLAPRSGLGTRGANLANTVGIVDHGYIDTIKAVIVNTGQDAIYIQKGDRFMQGVLIPIATPDIIIVDSLGDDSRGGFGSTGQ